MVNHRVSVFRKESFNSAHRLHNRAWSDEKNAAVFGKCNNPSFHGHNYELIVKVTGPVDGETGCVSDMGQLGALVRELVVDKYDHHNLDVELAEVPGLTPTAANIAIVSYTILRPHIGQNLALKIKLYDTE